MAVPASLMIDDGAPVNLMYWHCTWENHVREVPNSMLRDFASLCSAHGVMGKFSIPPMPAALGRIDDKLIGVPAGHLRTFLDIARKRISPRFDITLELLTHLVAYNIGGDYYEHMYEDAWISHATADQIADYISHGLGILKSVGLPATGVTSPWDTGADNEQAYAEGIARAFRRVHRRKRAWYFLHCKDVAGARGPWMAWQDKKAGIAIDTVPVNAGDYFWHTQYPTTAAAARKVARAGVDSLLSADGKSGIIRQLVDKQVPVTVATHWQSLFSNGKMAGMWGLELLLERMSKHLAGEIEWMKCSELAKLAREK